MAQQQLTRADAQAQTRGRLVLAAAGVFARRGYRGATLGEIAREAGFTVGAVYSNFATKQELFLAVLEEHVGARIDELAGALAAASTSAQAAELAAAGTARHLHDDPTWFPLFVEYWSEATRDPAVRERFADYQRATHRRLTELIERWAAEHGREPALPAADLAIVAKALTNGLALEREALPDGAADELLLRALRALVA